ncbi:aliphatic sulfonate ABC transporter substrate-binding protein [Flexivirga alba]|uniref:Aliphatic sulfonate ABC transporter substrate-binding protein n=1 Tax=Flexivirga alba TaxID=702742 RepID=A0ABW2ABW8_9MICO
MKNVRRATALISVVAAVVAVGSSLAACGSSGGAGTGSGATKIKIGYTADFSGSAAFAVAQKQGLFAKEGLDPDLKVFTNGPLQIQAFGSGDLDVGYIGPGALWLPQSGKAKVIGINQLGLADHLIARPGKAITSVADLKGKKVAVPQGTSGDMIFQLALKKAGLSPKDVNVVNMDPSTVVTAFSSGSVDAAATWYPLLDTIKKKVPNFVDLASDKNYYPQQTFPNVFVASNSYVDKHSATVKKFLRVVQQANDWIVKHPKEAEQIDAKYLKVPQENLSTATDYVKLLPSSKLVEDSKNGTVETWLDGLSTAFVQMGKVKSPLKAKDYYTADLYEAAAR